MGRLLTLLCAVVVGAALCQACDELLCASLVSKCLLLKSCECNMMDKANCTCCKDCHRCLSKLYTECCDCVEMCPSKTSIKTPAEKASSIEELTEPIPALFSALTEEADPEQRWTIYNYPAHLDLLYFKPLGEDQTKITDNHEGHRVRHGGHTITLDPDSNAINCTVAYHSQCMSLNKCKDSCQSMGAARYRWFHQYGCCECIGSTCLDYGKGEPLCLKCPLVSEALEEDGGYYYNEYYDENMYHENMYEEEDGQYDEEDNEDYMDEEDTPVKDIKDQKTNIAHGSLGGFSNNGL